ncbi:nucleotidyl transferase AbiEii/AbiGii toxin family protein [Streptomyces sp. NBC_00234]|uniref:nucleotidyl transferase AbiEii/AbiGii toxin family protein n=1 Tax=Streptomyces sp. NBC_00234 TaxID=2903638 RepID=UPI002E2E68DF|nr:nucleotidyl transferase AbiEii/AbiGii toxin family protein [Streptomyces sp. NBC_00234]
MNASGWNTTGENTSTAGLPKSPFDRAAPGEPVFADPALAPRWRAAHRAVQDHMLRLVAGAPWGAGVVLRGSLPVQVWVGEAAREPGDLDWVVLGTLEVHEKVVEALRTGPALPDGIRIDPSAVTQDVEWTVREYQTDGIRLLIPWEAEGLPAGVMRMDFAYDEEMPEAPVRLDCPRGDGGPSTAISAASPGLSLVWKLMWLVEDWDTEGRGAAKDLYDAMLLAEHPPTSLTPVHLRFLKEETGNWFTPQSVPHIDVDWEPFHAAHPWVDGDAEKTAARLERALVRLFAEAAGRP